MPSGYHMTVPKGFRKYHPIPKTIQLYFATLEEDEVCHFAGYQVTTPIRTIQDVVMSEVISDDIAFQAVSDALKKGILSLVEIQLFADKIRSEKLHMMLKELEAG